MANQGNNLGVCGTIRWRFEWHTHTRWEKNGSNRYSLFPYLPSSQQQDGARTIRYTACYLLFHIQSSWGVFSPYQPPGIFTSTWFHWGLIMGRVISLNWFAWSSLIQIWPCWTSDFVRIKWASQHTFPERLLCSWCLQVTNTYQADNESPTNQRTASH